MLDSFLSYTQTASGLYVPEDVVLETQRPKALDLFCGAGGFSLGMERGGFDVFAAADADATAAITYLMNLGAYPVQFWWLDDTAEERMERALQQHMDLDKKGKARGGITVPWVSGGGRKRGPGEPEGCRHFFFGDIRNMKGAEVLAALGMEPGELDCIFGGPPCQGFSTAGRREVMDPRNSLVFDFVRLVVEMQPKTMVMENVPGLLSMVTPEGLPVVDEICLRLEAGGWATAEAVKRSLTGDRRAAVRSRPKKGAPQQEETQAAPAEPTNQLGLFGAG